MIDPILDAIQAKINEDSSVDDGGWQVTMYIAVLGMSRITPDGQIENSTALYYPAEQHPCSTDGLFIRGQAIHEMVDVDEDCD